jgi:hypothetical protein
MSGWVSESWSCRFEREPKRLLGWLDGDHALVGARGVRHGLPARMRSGRALSLRRLTACSTWERLPEVPGPWTQLSPERP